MLTDVCDSSANLSNYGEQIQAKKNLIAIYMTGSDLESLNDLATSDLREMVNGYSNNSSTTLDLMIGYGGSHKKGWRGMTIATPEDIQSDLSDGVIGDGPYQYRVLSKSMGTKEVLNDFIEHITIKRGYDHYYLIIWDHGNSYGGICYDENSFQGSPPAHLTISDLNAAISGHTIRWDIIGMDACYMSSIEVATALQESGTYLIASEEAEPGSGWNYSAIIRRISEEPSINHDSFGKFCIDTFIDNPSSHRKTLSMIDLRHISKITKSLKDLGSTLSGNLSSYNWINGIGSSYNRAYRIKTDPDTDTEIAIDLGQFIDRMSKEVPENEEICLKLIEDLHKAVIYVKNDEFFQGLSGLSIYSPRNTNISGYETFRKEVAINADWEKFVSKYLKYISTDKIDPEIFLLDEGVYRITDNIGVEKAYLVYWGHIPLHSSSERTYFSWQQPLYPNETGLYEINPEVEIFYLQDSTSGYRDVFDYSYNKNEGDGLEYYSAWINVTNHQYKNTRCLLTIIRDPFSGSFNYFINPTYKDYRSGQDIISKVNIIPQAGDVITPHYAIEKPNSSVIAHEVGYPMILSGPLSIIRAVPPQGLYYIMIEAYDYNRNFNLAINTSYGNKALQSSLFHKKELFLEVYENGTYSINSERWRELIEGDSVTKNLSDYCWETWSVILDKKRGI